MTIALVPHAVGPDTRSKGRSLLKPWLLATAIAFAGALIPVTSAFALTDQVKQAEKLIWGVDGHSSPAAGRQMLEKSGAEGDLSAKRILGLHLIFGWVLSKDTAAGFDLLNAAVEGGDAAAHTALAEIYLWGLTGTIDIAKARDLLEKASALNDPKAIRTLGELLVLGEKFDRDVAAGLALLDRGAAMNDAKAHVVLGNLYLAGRGVPRDRAKARAAFEAAAALGDGEGLAIYGEDMMWREAGPVTSEKMLLRAAETGATEAYATLAEGAMYGYFTRGAFSRERYTRYAEKADEYGEEKLAVLEAERSIWGIGQRASGPAAVAGLTAAADNGNGQAAEFLVALLRDGNHYNVRRSIPKAREALEKYAPLLNDRKRAQYALSIDAAAARNVDAYAAVADTYKARPELKSVWFGKEIYKANPNVAMFILQQRFKAQGMYSGSLSGYATRSTLRAVYNACAEKLDLALCNDTVMRPEVIGGLLALE